MNVVILGGTGYIGRAVTRKMLEADDGAHVITVSRSGANELRDSRITNVRADCVIAHAILAVIPHHVDIIIDLVGGMDSAEQNIAPARATAEVVEALDIPKIGYVGGTLGSKVFVSSKVEAVRILEGTGRDVVVVEPTLVYGGGRHDSLSKMVPIMKFLGLFSKRFKPVTVDSVADELVTGLLSAS